MPDLGLGLWLIWVLKQQLRDGVFCEGYGWCKKSMHQPDMGVIFYAPPRKTTPTGGRKVSEHHEDDNLGVLSDRFLAHALTPVNLGALPHPDGHANPTGACGDRIELYLRVQDEVVTDARFLTEGCLHTVACGSAITSLIKGREVSQVMQVGADEVEEELGGLPKPHRHCAVLAAVSLKAALRDYYKKKQAPWKGAYGDR